MIIIEYQKSYSERRFSILVKKDIILKLAIILLLVISLLTIYYLIAKSPQFLEPYKKFFPYLLIITFGAIIYLKNYLEDLELQEDIAYKGIAGENKVIDFLKRSLDHNYIYVKNYSLPNIERGDIDDLIIGPKGIILIEIKNYSGKLFRVSGLDLYRKKRCLIYQLYLKSSIKQILKQAYLLKQFLKDNNFYIKIISIVAMVDSKIEKISGLKNCYVMNYHNLDNFISKLPDLEYCDKELYQNILNALGVKNLETSSQKLSS